jgi:ribosomal protein S18 acetylase RimI-like enzyme
LSATIRAVSPADTDALVALWSEIFPEYNDPKYPQRDPRTNIARKLAMEDGLFWVATQGDALIGTVMAGYDGNRGWMYTLGVAQAARRAGVASGLLLHAEAALKARGCVKINMQVMAGKDAALAFYAKHGYGQDAVISIGKRI